MHFELICFLNLELSYEEHNYKCLGIRNVNLFNVYIKICQFFVFNGTGSVKMQSG